MDQQQGGLATSAPGHGKLRVFISYSRNDLDFADQLDVALRLYGFDTTLDRHAISGGEEWQQRLEQLIREADTVVFVLSPASAGSDICAWEVETASQLGKRIIPAVPLSLADASPPQQLRDLNYVFFYAEPKSPGSGFGSGLTQLVAALNTDLEWLREHTRLFLRATEWISGGRAENRLLSGSDIAAAKIWAARRPKDAPEPTPLHLDFIRASEEAEDARLSAQRKQLAEMAAAQEDRQKALVAAEQALERTISLKRRQAWAAATVVVIFAAIGWWAYGVINEQLAVTRDASRQDIRGQIVAYAAAFGSEEADTATGSLTSPYTTPLAQKLRQKKSVIDAIEDAHQQVLASTDRKQRPLLSTSMNGPIYLYRQPPTRRKVILAVSVDDPGAPFHKLNGPANDVGAIVGALIDTGFAKDDVTILHNPDRGAIAAEIARIGASLRHPAVSGLQQPEPPTIVPAGVATEPQALEPPANTLFVFFFSGHGLQIDESDLIIPKLEKTDRGESEVDTVKRSGMSVASLTRKLEESAAASIVILDTHFPKVR